MILYISNDDTTSSCNNSALAHAGSCRQDQYGRPVAGTINICNLMIPTYPPDTTNPEFWKEDVLVMVHEVGHVMIMSSFLWNYFWDPDANAFRNINEVWDTNDPMGDGKRYIISPKVANNTGTF